MASSLNKVQIIGHLGRDPEVKSFANGGKIVNLRVATSESWKDKQSGEKKERTEWHSVVIHAEHAAKFAEQYLRKGSQVYVEGKIETRKWQDQSGADRYSTEITVRPYGGELQSLDKRESNGGGGRTDERSGGGREDNSGGGNSGGTGYGGGGRPNSDMDDEIPFAPEFR